MSATAPVLENSYSFTSLGPAMAEMSHVELLRACSTASDERLWDEFVARYNRFICLSVIRAYGQRGGRRYADVDVVNDLVQDVYLKLFESTRGALRGFRGENDAGVFVYIGRVAISVVVDHLRRNGARKRGVDAISLDAPLAGDEDGHELTLADRLVAAGPSPEQEATASIFRTEVSDILAHTRRGRNGERDAKIAEAFIFDGCTLSEIADRFDDRMRESGIKSSIRRTSLRIRGEIARMERCASSSRARSDASAHR